MREEWEDTPDERYTKLREVCTTFDYLYAYLIDLVGKFYSLKIVVTCKSSENVLSHSRIHHAGMFQVCSYSIWTLFFYQ